MTRDCTEGTGGMPLPPGARLVVTGPYPARRRLPGRRPAVDAAERLQREHPGAEVRAVRLRDCDGLEAVAGGERVAGSVDEVAGWLARQAPAAGAVPGASAAGGNDDGKGA